MNKHAQSLGKLGGKARAKSLSKERRSEIARMGAVKRWKLDKNDINSQNVLNA